MKRFLNYIFYFTCKLHNIIGYYCVEKPLDYLFSLSEFWGKHNKRGKKDAGNIIENPYYGFNIGFAFHCMLVLFFILSSWILSLLMIFGGIGLNDIKFGVYVFFTLVFLMSYIPLEILLGWHKKTYLIYFKEFERANNKRLGYMITLCFHFGVILLGILTVYFYTGFDFLYQK